MDVTRLFETSIEILRDECGVEPTRLLDQLKSLFGENLVPERFAEFVVSAFPDLVEVVDRGYDNPTKRHKPSDDGLSKLLRLCPISEGGNYAEEFHGQLTNIYRELGFADCSPLPLEEIISRYFDRSTSALENLLDELKQEEWYENQMQVYMEPERPKDSVCLDIANMNPIVVRTLQNFMHDPNLELYTHQKLALESLQAGNDICISTSTASGKSLIFMAHALLRLLSHPDERVLAIYPTKALAQDQLIKWRSFMSSSIGMPREVRVEVIDGDTPFEDRKSLAENADIVLTNLDFCHKTILRGMNSYTPLIKNLGFLIADEAHIYRGVFGAHSALTLRRILLCHELIATRTDPVQIITCTATLGNPDEHFKLLTGRQKSVTIVSDGSPAPPKIFVLWDPPTFKYQSTDRALFSIKDFHAFDVPSTVAKSTEAKSTIAKSTEAKSTEAKSTEAKSTSAVVKLNEPVDTPKFELDLKNEEIKVSAINESMRLFLFMVKKRVKTFLFCNARSLVEGIFTAVLSKLTAQERTQIVSYRGGYAKEERRLIEQKIFKNEVFGVISTNALELGIDLGLLDVVITLGFEGSVSSVRQRLGRAGRSGTRPCLGILVAFDSPVERFVVRQLGNSFWKKPPEPISFDPENVMLLKQHLVCSVKECPNKQLTRDILEKHFGLNARYALEVALKTGEIRIQNGFLKFGITSRFLMVSGAQDEYDRPAEFQPPPALIRPKVDRVTVEAFPFMSSLHREAMPGTKKAEEKSQAQEDLDHDLWLQQIADTAQPIIRKPTLKSDKEAAPIVSLNDLSGMKDSKKFVDAPHSIVDLRSTGIPDVVVYASGLQNRSASRESGGYKRVADDDVAHLPAIDQMNLVAAFITMFPGAIYKIRGQEFKATVFNYSKRYAIVTPIKDCDYHTAAGDRHSYSLVSQEKLLNHFNQSVLNPDCDVYLGQLRIRWTVPKYYHIPKNGRKITSIDLMLPDLAYDTRGLVFDIKEKAIGRFYSKARGTVWRENDSRASEDESLLLSGIHGLGHALCKAATTVIWCDLRDIESSCVSPLSKYSVLPSGRLHLYEKPSSIALGLIDLLCRDNGKKLAELLLATRVMLNTCECNENSEASGCLDCVLLPYCLERNALVDCRTARIVLDEIACVGVL